MDINALYRLWLEKAAGHPALRDELEAIRGDDAAIEDRFYRELEFGTGGLRGVLGAGTNRMNVHVVRRAAQARPRRAMPNISRRILPPPPSPSLMTAASTPVFLPRPRRVFLPQPAFACTFIPA